MSGQSHDPRGRGRRGRAKDGGSERMPRGAEPGVAHGIHQATGRGRGKWAPGSPAATQPPLTFPSHATADHPCQDAPRGGHRMFEGVQPTEFKPDSTVTDRRHLSRHSEGEPFATPTTSIPLPACDQYEDDIHNTGSSPLDEVLVKDTLVISDIPRDEKVDQEYLELLFTSPKRSGGKPDAAKVIDKQEGMAMIKFESDEVAANVLKCAQTQGVKVNGKLIRVEYAKKVPETSYERRRLKICALPKEVDKEYLEMFLERQIREQKCCIEELSHATQSAIVAFQEDLSLSDFEDIQYKVTSKAIKGIHLQVERCRVVTELRVKNITKHKDEDFLQMYFENENKSGGGECTCKFDGEDAVVKFRDPKALERVLRKIENHAKYLGNDIELLPLTPAINPYSNYGPSQAHSQCFPELRLTVKPLVAKALHKHSSLVMNELKELNVEIDIEQENGLVLVRATPASKSNWKELCKQHFANYSEMSIKLPDPSFVEHVKTMITSTQLEQGEVFAHDISSDKMEVTVAGPLNVIQVFKSNCQRAIDLQSQAKVVVLIDNDDYEFLQQVTSFKMIKEHPEIKITFLPDKSSICLEGPSHCVQQLKDHIPELLKHSEIDVGIDETFLSFLLSKSGKESLMKYLSEKKAPFGFRFNRINSERKLFLICELQHQEWATSLAISLKDDMTCESVDIPAELTSTLSSLEEFTVLVKGLEAECHSQVLTNSNQILIFGFQKSVARSAQRIKQLLQKQTNLLKPIRLRIDKLLAIAFNKHSTGFNQMLQDLHVKGTIDTSGFIDIQPIQHMETDWQNECHSQITQYLDGFSTSSISSLPKTALADILSYLGKTEKEDVVFAYSFTDNSTGVAVAGTKEVISDVQKKVEEICVTHSMASKVIQMTPQKYVFLHEVKRAEITAKFPGIDIKYDTKAAAITLSGSLHDIQRFQDYLPDQKCTVLTLSVEKTVAKFLCSQVGQSELQAFKHKYCKCPAGVYIEQNTQSVQLVSDQKDSLHIDEFAKFVSQKVTARDLELPKSFFKLNPQASSMLNDAFTKVRREQNVVFHEKEALIQIVGFELSVITTYQRLSELIRKECAVSEEVSIDRGVWKLFQTHLNPKWKSLVSRHQDSQVVCINETSDKIKVLLTGDEKMVERIKSEIGVLIQSVATAVFSVRSPGICKYFRGQTMKDWLTGFEQRRKVAIEMSEKEADEEASETEISVTSVAEVCMCYAQVQTASGIFKEIKICIGDISEFKVDVIVNAANARLQHCGGVAKVISDKGGPQIQLESDRHMSEVVFPLDSGDVWMSTKTGMLSCKAIIHAVGPIWSGGHQNESYYLKTACNNCLKKAKKYTSIAIPAISCGIYGYPLEQCATVLTQTAVNFFKETKSLIPLKEIQFVLKDEKHALAFCNVLARNKDIVGTMNINPSKMIANIEQQQEEHSATLPIHLHKGMLLDIEADVYVNTTNSNLNLSQGSVARHLAARAGPTLQEECTAKVSKGPINVGDIAVTGAGTLPCRYIYHAVAPQYQRDSEKTLRLIIQKCLKKWHKKKLKSIAFPAIGTGNLRFPDSVVAKVMVEETTAFLSKTKVSHGASVHFVIYEQKTYQAFRNELGTHMQIKRKTPSTEGPIRVTGNTASAVQQATVFTVGSLKIHIVQGDITCDNSDAVVNTTNANIKLEGSGVAAALLKKGGKELQMKCDLAVTNKGPLKQGEVICTDATGKLQCKSLFHVVFTSTDPKMLLLTIKACLLEGDTMNYSSIAFPALGTGAHGYPAEESAKLMKQAFDQFMPQNLSTINVVLFHQDIYQNFLQCFSDVNDDSDVSDYDKSGDDDDYDDLKQSDEPATISQRVYNFVATTASAAGAFFTGSVTPDDDQESQQPDFEISSSETIPKQLVIKIYAESQDLVKQARQDLQEVIEDNSTTERIIDPNLSKLCADDWRRVQIKCSELEVTMTDHLEADVIRLKGAKTDVKDIAMILQRLTQSAERKTIREDSIKTLFTVVQWIAVNPPNNHVEYDPEQNFEIEEAYKRYQETKRDKCFKYHKDQFNFTIDFRSMKETNEITKKKRKVKRVDLRDQKGVLPNEWDDMEIDPITKQEKRVQTADLSCTDDEYKTVLQLFNTTVCKGTDYKEIVKIQRVQRPLLYHNYMQKKKEMDYINPKGHQNEQLLFHGTSKDAVDAIMYRSFDRSRAGETVGHLYGKGSYFAVDAKYSIRYARADSDGNCYMYLVRVLTGQYTKGSKDIIQPPPRDPASPIELFDSTVDDPKNPKIFAVFTDAQAYPAYLIIFKK